VHTCFYYHDQCVLFYFFTLLYKTVQTWYILLWFNTQSLNFQLILISFFHYRSVWIRGKWGVFLGKTLSCYKNTRMCFRSVTGHKRVVRVFVENISTRFTPKRWLFSLKTLVCLNKTHIQFTKWTPCVLCSTPGDLKINTKVCILCYRKVFSNVLYLKIPRFTVYLCHVLYCLCNKSGLTWSYWQKSYVFIKC
jgi:hypothetical protein